MEPDISSHVLKHLPSWHLCCCFSSINSYGDQRNFLKNKSWTFLEKWGNFPMAMPGREVPFQKCGKLAVTSSNTVLAACGLLFFMHFWNVPSWPPSKRLSSYPSSISAWLILQSLLWQPLSQGVEQKLVSKCEIPCWKKLECVGTDILVLALPKTALSFNEIAPLNKVLCMNFGIWRVLDSQRAWITFCIWALSTVYVYVYRLKHVSMHMHAQKITYKTCVYLQVFPVFFQAFAGEEWELGRSLRLMAWRTQLLALIRSVNTFVLLLCHM